MSMEAATLPIKLNQLSAFMCRFLKHLKELSLVNSIYYRKIKISFSLSSFFYCVFFFLKKFFSCHQLVGKLINKFLR